MHFWHKCISYQQKFIYIFIHFYTLKTKYHLTIENVLSGVLIPKLISNPLASCSCINLDFLIPQIQHLNFIIVLLFFVLKILAAKFSGFFFYTLHNKLACFIGFNLLKIETQKYTAHSCSLFYQKTFY